MSAYDELFMKCAPFQLSPPYQGKEIRMLRGIALPQDYIDFLRLHNGGSFSNPNDGDPNRLVLFSLEDIQKGDGIVWFHTQMLDKARQRRSILRCLALITFS